MKTLEQKAKAYDEAIERAKIWQNHLNECGDKDYADELNYIFPELAKSEDEKIRQEIMDYLKSQQEISFIQSSMYDTWLTWFEKQGENPTDEEMKELLQTEYEKGRADALADLRTE